MCKNVAPVFCKGSGDERYRLLRAECRVCYAGPMVAPPVPRRYTHVLHVGLWWRVLYGLLRVVLGVALLRMVGMPLIEVVRAVMSHELVEEPSDVLVSLAGTVLTHHPMYVTYFLACYFIFWGVVDVFLSLNLLRGVTWAFPVSMWMIGFFLLYGTYRFMHTHSLILLSILVLDAGLLWLIRNEYRASFAARALPAIQGSV